MISLARAGGASKDLLEWVTHGPPGDVIDGYTTLPWETLCQQVVCIKVERREGRILAMPTAASAASSRGAVIDLTPRSTPAHSLARRSSGISNQLRKRGGAYRIRTRREQLTNN